MFARVTVIQAKVDKLDEAISIFREGVIPEAKEQHGFKGCYFLTNQQTGKCMAITFWNSEDDAKVNEQSGYYSEQISRFVGIFTEAPLREGYEASLRA